MSILEITALIAAPVALVSLCVNIVIFIKNRKDKIKELNYNYRDDNIKLREENFELKQKLAANDDIKRIEEDLIYSKSTYYRKSEVDKGDKYYCTNCWDNNKKLITVRLIQHDLSRTAYCGVCKSQVNFDSKKDL